MLVGPGGEFVIPDLTFIVSVEILKLSQFLSRMPIPVAVYDGVIISCPLAIEFIKGEVQAVHFPQCCYRHSELQAPDIQLYRLDIIPVYTINVSVQLGLSR
jgi:hypothetical protein